MSVATPSNLSVAPALRRWLRLDAASCLLLAAPLIAATETVASLTGMSPGLLRAAGLLLLPCAALMLFAPHAGAAERALALVVIVGNVAWAAASAYLAWAYTPITALGVFAVAAQAAFVLAMAVLEGRAWRETIDG